MLKLINKIKKKFKKEEEITKWQFYVISHTHQGYRINENCDSLWETPKGVPKFFLGTRTQAYTKSLEMRETWKEKFMTYPLDIKVQDYIDIPDFN